MREVLRHLTRRHAAFVLTCAGLSGAFQFLIAAAVASVDIGGALEVLVQMLPPLLQALIQDQLFGGSSAAGLIAFGWNHPLAHALGAAVAIVLAARAVAGEIESGAMELLLSQPLSRLRYLAAQVLFGLAAIALVPALGLAGSVLGQRAFGLAPFPPERLWRLGACFWALQCAWFGVTLLASSAGRENGRAASAGFLVALVSFIAMVIGTVWDRAAFVLPYVPHDWFMPREILAAGVGVGTAMAKLGALGAACAGVGAWWFRRRDLP